MEQFVSQPRKTLAAYWDGSSEGARTILDHISKLNNATAHYRPTVDASRRRIRIYARGRVMDVLPGWYFAHDQVSDEIAVYPADYFREHFKLRAYFGAKKEGVNHG